VERLFNDIRQKLAALRPILAPYSAHLAVAGLAVLLGISAGVYQASKDPTAVDTADKWPFPQWAPFRTGPQREALARTAIWAADPTKVKAEAEKKQPAGPPWRFIGTLQNGKTRIAIIELDQGKRVQRIATGEPLPNGAMIKKIDTSALIYDDNGVERVLKLFGTAKTDSLPAGSGKN
jgi:hypothetical protein